MHSKFAILDNASVWTGSWNYTDAGTFKNNENVIAIDSPEIASAFAREFQKLLDGLERGKLSSEAKVAEAASLPHGVRVFFAPDDPTLDVLRTVFGQAKKSILFMTMAFTDTDLAAILQDRATHGVAIRGIVEKSLARLPVAKSLLMGSVPNLEVREDGNPRYLRHNCVIVDDRMVLMGSMNLSITSGTRNNENLLSIPDAALASKFTEEFERLWAMAKKNQHEPNAETHDEENSPIDK